MAKQAAYDARDDMRHRNLRYARKQYNEASRNLATTQKVFDESMQELNRLEKELERE